MSINQPTVLRCLAGGHPKPYVSWWRDTEMLPLTSERFEQNRDYSLVFKQVELVDLGPYVCQAYSGVGKPKSMTVTLKTVGPIQSRTPEEDPYLQYVLDPADVHTERPVVYRPIQPRPPTTHAPAPPRNGKLESVSSRF